MSRICTASPEMRHTHQAQRSHCAIGADIEPYVSAETFIEASCSIPTYWWPVGGGRYQRGGVDNLPVGQLPDALEKVVPAHGEPRFGLS